jgi:hypothetical protein
MGELRIDGAADHLHATAGELVVAAAEGDQFRRADEGEIEGIEKQDDVLVGLAYLRRPAWAF